MIDIFVCLGLCDIRSKEHCYLNYASNTKKHNFASNTITVLYKHIQYHLCYINLAYRKRNGYATERVQKVKSPERCVYWNRKKKLWAWEGSTSAGPTRENWTESALF